MNLVIVLLAWTTVIATAHDNEESEEEKQERIISELKFTDWDLADYYEGITKARKNILLHAEIYTNEIKLIDQYGDYLKEQSVRFQNISEDDIPYDYTRNYTFLLKPGDFLLNKTELHKLVTFAKENDHLSRNLRITYPNASDQKIGRQSFLDLLATSRNFSQLQDVWSSWQSGVSKYENNFGSILPLVAGATSRNEMYDTKAYWEMLTEHKDGYQTAETLWNDIEPLYRKLHGFVLERINNYYERNFTNIPVYLTGSNFGEDWSNLAEMVIPHQQMYQDAKFTFETTSIKDIYKLADDCGQTMGFQKLKKQFWSESNFDYEHCTPTLLMYSNLKYSEIMTCKNVTWDTYLNAHEVILKAGLKSLDFESLPRRELRYSPLDEAIVSLGSIIAIQNLPNYGFTPETDYLYLENATEHGLSSKLLVALRVLPKLAYYMAADVWRLEELENTSVDIKSSWWEMRKKYQGVEGVLNAEADFLDDSYIASNKPYLAKFLGTVLQFQLLAYHQLYPFTNNDNLAEQLVHELDYKNAILDIPLKAPMDVLLYNYGFSDIVAEYLTEFFQPLEEYLDNASLVPYSTTARERKLKIDIPPEDVTEKMFITTTKTVTTTVKTNDLDVPIVQNDQEVSSINHSDNKDNINPTETSAVPAAGYSAGIYVLITIGACFFILVGVVVFKKVVKMKRPRTNNRRFEA